MATQPAPETPVDFNTPALKGWQNFTKFLTVNAMLCAAALVFIGLLTVWR